MVQQDKGAGRTQSGKITENEVTVTVWPSVAEIVESGCFKHCKSTTMWIWEITTSIEIRRDDTMTLYQTSLQAITSHFRDPALPLWWGVKKKQTTGFWRQRINYVVNTGPYLTKLSPHCLFYMSNKQTWNLSKKIIPSDFQEKKIYTVNFT